MYYCVPCRMQVSDIEWHRRTDHASFADEIRDGRPCDCGELNDDQLNYRRDRGGLVQIVDAAARAQA